LIRFSLAMLRGTLPNGQACGRYHGFPAAGYQRRRREERRSSCVVLSVCLLPRCPELNGSRLAPCSGRVRLIFQQNKV
jgi:hypothetical protein